jgi:tRNA nucleotidyltransferase (CCA-adding enzyme)
MSKNVLARELMSRPVRQLTAQTPVRDAAAFLLRHGISGAPVLDEHGRWIGVFTQNDLARSVQVRIVPPRLRRTLESREPVVDLLALPAEELGRTPVKEFMTRGLFTVFPEATIEEVIRTMTSFKIHRVFVIDEKEGTIEGVITTMDVLRWLEGRKSRRGNNNRKTQRV